MTTPPVTTPPVTTPPVTTPPVTTPPVTTPPDRAVDGRCPWAVGETYVTYHDEEWGRPVHGETALFERFSLEAFQSGLSWLTVLRKREAFRGAFAGFDPEAVARFNGGDVDRLLADSGIVRNRAKILAVVGNAQAVLDLRPAGGLDGLVWSHAPVTARPAPRSAADVPATTPESVALAHALRAAGFRFVGPTTAYAAMQACGLVDDHLDGCPARVGGVTRGRHATRVRTGDNGSRSEREEVD